MNKTILITGATNGIGKEAARALAQQGHQLVLVARDAGRAEATRKELEGQGGQGKVELLLGDLSRPSEALRVAEEYKKRFKRLDVLINNAGAYFATRELTADSNERTFALNHLGYFALTTALLDLLKASAPARIVSVSSDAHRGGVVDFEDLHFAKRRWMGGWPAYSQSKLANLLMTRELARRLDGTKVTANAVHPGFVASRFGLNNDGGWRWVLRAAQVFARTSQKGAETIVHLATSPEVEGVTGQYFFDKKPHGMSSAAKDDVAARKLWEVSERWIQGSAHAA